MNDTSLIANGVNFTFPDKANVGTERLFFRLPLDRINWLTSSFLIGTLALTLTAVPLYLWIFGLDWFQVVLFFAALCCARDSSTGPAPITSSNHPRNLGFTSTEPPNERRRC